MKPLPPPPALISLWTPHHQRIANREGWDIFECIGSSDGDWQICRIDSPDDFDQCDRSEPIESDQAAWALVAQGDNPTRSLALSIISKLNPPEYERIINAGKCITK